MKFNSNPFSTKSIESARTPDLQIPADFNSLIENTFNTYTTPHERVKDLLSKINLFFKYLDKDVLSQEKIYEIKKDLINCANFEDKERFISEVSKALFPLVEIRAKHINEFEEARNMATNEKQGYITLNRLVTYEKNGEIINLNHSHARAVSPLQHAEYYRDAMSKLAQIVNEDPEIEMITAASYLIDKILRKKFERYGFKVEDSEEKDEEGRKIAFASISRQKFLEKFLKK